MIVLAILFALLGLSLGAPSTAPCEEHFFNFGQILQGYDAIKGNPNSLETTDPGFRGLIFNSTYKGDTTSDGKYCVPSGMHFQSCEGSCNVRATRQASQTFGEKSYREQLGTKIKGLAETGTVASFGASTEFKTVHTESHKSFFLQSDSTCCTYQSTISLYDIQLGKLNFTDAFKLAITELPEEYDPTSLGAYTTFVGEFGTHYAKRSTMGARYGIQAKVERSEYSKSTDTSHDLETKVSELELESIGVYNNGSSHSSYIDKDTNWEVSMYSRGASPPKDNSAADWIEKVDKNQHPVPIQMDVGGLWELAEIQHFPELQGSVEMERKLAAVKANLEKYIKTDYCQYLLDLGLVFSCAAAPEDLGPAHLSKWCHGGSNPDNTKDGKSRHGKVCEKPIKALKFHNQVYHNFLHLINFGLIDVDYKCGEEDKWAGNGNGISPWPNGLEGGHDRWQSELGTCNVSNSDGFEYLTLWTWNDHGLGADPLGVVDVETQCISGHGGHFHAVNDNEPYSGSYDKGEGTKDEPCKCESNERIVGLNAYIGEWIGIEDIQLVCRQGKYGQ